jgi:hypothetical protein
MSEPASLCLPDFPIGNLPLGSYEYSVRFKKTSDMVFTFDHPVVKTISEPVKKSDPMILTIRDKDLYSIVAIGLMLGLLLAIAPRLFRRKGPGSP